MATMELTKILRFSAAHRLASPALSAAENRRLLRAVLRRHGHNYALEATVRGPVDADGMVMDAAVLEQAMRRSSISWTTGISAATSPRSAAWSRPARTWRRRSTG